MAGIREYGNKIKAFLDSLNGEFLLYIELTLSNFIYSLLYEMIVSVLNTVATQG
jgi:hypothetical protein